MSAGLTILCYHRVLPDAELHGNGRPYFLRGTAVSIGAFRAQLAALCASFEIVAEADVLAWLAGERVFVRPACWLTFDDGYADVLSHAAPILAELGAPATAFIATDVLDGGMLPADRWYAVLNKATRRRGTLEGGGTRWSFDLDSPPDYARLVDGPERRRYLARTTKPERETLLGEFAAAVGAPVPRSLDGLYMGGTSLRALVDAGWSVGSHTQSHPFLPLLADDGMDAELRGSRSALASVGIDARSFAYPNGR